MQDKIKLKIDEIEVEVEKGTTLLEAAKKINVHIPTLCFLKEINEIGDCRMCLVEVEGRKGFVASCMEKAEEGMIVKTNTGSIMDARRTMLDLILSNHNRDCLTCTRNGNCELQALAEEFNITEIKYEGERQEHKIDELSPSIVRDASKCILCRRCVSVCKKVQEVGAIDVINRGFNSCVSTAENASLNDVNCTFCGQCIEVCPVGALKEKDNTKVVWNKLKDKNSYVVVQTAPSVRVALGEEFGMPIGTNVEGKMIAALKKLGFNKVFDTNTGADLTIMEEANEFIERLTKNKTLPMITSCCPGWVKFIEMNYPELLEHLSTCKSPQGMFGTMIKTYYAQKLKIDADKIYNVAVMPCIAKKFESKRKELENEHFANMDAVITTRELARMIKQAHIDFTALEPEEFDSPTGEATGAGAIFGVTGGVMEAALRTVVETLTDKELQKIELESVRGKKGIKKANIQIGDTEAKVVVAHGLSNARKVLEEIKSGLADYQFVEIMACPGGCIMGGGQPIHSAREKEDLDIRALRANAMYTIDERSKIRKSHESPIMKKLYREYLEKPGSHKAHELLHTYYQKREKYTTGD